ncbi:MAG: T9SS type A sorting domain-containing protein [Bacteroidetes bacterium]|nr:T9SS type A sorting domain-containing protein [Bacteroidota bacterium]
MTRSYRLITRLTLLILLSGWALESSAQNWSWFPKDSLRIFINPTQHEELYTGIDYRSHRSENVYEIIDLSEFSRLDTLDDNGSGNKGVNPAFYIHGNSNFGHHIISTDSAVNVIFKHNEGNNDTLNFIRKPKLSESWIVLSKPHCEITAKMLNYKILNDDSVLTIGIDVMVDTVAAKGSYIMRIGKKFGIMESPIWYEILNYPKDLANYKSVTLNNYQEKSEFDFNLPETGTVIDYTITKANGSSFAFEDRRDSFVSVHGDSVLIKSHIYKGLLFMGEGETSKEQNVYWKKYLGSRTQILNPIPGKVMGEDDNWRLIDPCNRSYFCDKYLLAGAGSAGSGVYSRSGDTIYHHIEVSQPGYLRSSYLEGVGEIQHYSYGYIGSGTYNLNWKYIYIPGVCEKGERLWSYTSTEEPGKTSYSVYPNPANDIIHLPSAHPPMKEAYLIDVAGKRINCTTTSHRIFLPQVATGMYTLIIETIAGKEYDKLFIDQR